MDNVIVALFKTPSDARVAMRDLENIVKKHRSVLKDVCGVFRDHTGGISLKQMFDRPDRFFVAGLSIGALAGMIAGFSTYGIFAMPVTTFAGAIIGLALAALSAMLIDFGLDNDFIQQVGSELKTDSAAIVIMHNPEAAEALLSELNQFPVTILRARYHEAECQDLQETMSNMLRGAPAR